MLLLKNCKKCCPKCITPSEHKFEVPTNSLEIIYNPRLGEEDNSKFAKLDI